MTEQKKFEDWFEQEKKNGLVNIHFCMRKTFGKKLDITRENFCSEANSMINAFKNGETVERPEIF
jgi:hypothetical protein